MHIKNKFISRLRQKSFFSDIFVVLSGTASAQLIGLLIMPVISRLFTKTDFGIYGSFVSILGILAAFVTLQYSQALMLPKNLPDALYLFYASCLSSMLLTLVSIILVVGFPNLIKGIFGVKDSWLLLLLPIAVITSGLYQSLQAWSVRLKAFKYTSSSQIVGSLASSGVWLAAGVGHTGALGLTFGPIVSNAFSIAYLLRKLTKYKNSISINLKRLWEIIIKYHDFPLYSAPQHTMNAASQGLPILLLGKFYGVGVAGLYAFSTKILQAPMTLILTSLRQVLFQRACELYNSGGNLGRLFMKTTLGLVGISIIPATIIFFYAPHLFVWLFGEEWWEAGVYARWLGLWLFIAFCNVPAVLFARVLRKQRSLFYYESMVLITRATILVAGGLYWPPMKTIIAFSLLGFLFNVGLILWVGMLLRSKECSDREIEQSISKGDIL